VHPVESYLAKLAEIRASGHATDETSYYPAIEALLAEIGKRLKPRVLPVLQLKNRGADHPDGGLFTQDQLRKNAVPDDFSIQPPNRGAVEVKGPAEDLAATAQTEQVKKYLRIYSQVLLTNYREFHVVTAGEDGKPRALETLTLAKNEAAFWTLAAHPRKASGEFGQSLEEFLTRALLSAVKIQTPDVLASFLASYAREALAKIEPRSSLKELEDVRKALEAALGLKFEKEKGEHFFRSTLVQTLFYGLFSAWVLWSREPGRQKGDLFDWRLAVFSLQVPMIRALYERLVIPSHLRSMGLLGLLDLTGEVLNRVDKDAFFLRFEEDTAVQYFYEPFLEAFDPALRKQLGVWYTPREIVRYMVERVDRVLRTELGLASGLADPNVYVLDPACGTGAYLVEVLARIHRTLKEERGEDALTPHQLKQAAKERVFGFEILPAPFVIAHLQLGMFLQRAQAPLEAEHEGKRERAGVYLTNALTGWEPPDKQKARLPFQEFEEEREEADKIKQEKKILVVLGNPPYYAFAGVSPEEENGLVEPYKEGLSTEWKIRKYNLDELYVRFLRLAERRIAEMSRRGVICYISSYSYLSDPSFVVVRKRLSGEFNSAWIDCLNGDSRETGKLTPDGKPDPSVFSTDSNREGIRLGTAVGLFAKNGGSEPLTVHYREFWGTRKREELLASLNDESNAHYEQVIPTAEHRFSFRPAKTELNYATWPTVIELAEVEPISGLQEMRRGALMAFDKGTLCVRMKSYFDGKINWETFAKLGTGLSKNAGRFDALAMRTRLQATENFDQNRLKRYALYPLDNRWCYYSSVRPLWNEPRPELVGQCPQDESFLIVRRFAERPNEGRPAFFTSALPDYHLLRPNVSAIPLRLRTTLAEGAARDPKQMTLHRHLESSNGTTANLSALARGYLGSLTRVNPDEDDELSRKLWFHVLTILYSPLYLREHNSAVRADWPRIPLPLSLEQFTASATLGRRVAELLDTEQPVSGVTAGALRHELRGIAALSQTGSKPLEIGEDFKLTAGWGHAGKEGVTMPGRGKLISRERTAKESAELAQGIAALGLTEDAALARLGSTVVDVYLNDRCAWANVPEKVWELTIGGYQVMKKWLSYREFSFLNRPLTLAEVDEVQAMARRLAALCLLQPELDANYLKVKSATWQAQSAPISSSK
jgi:hypothetical protein